MLSKIRLAIPVLPLMLLVTPFSAYAADASGNIRISIPSQVQYCLKSDGSLASPVSDVLSIENNSDFEVRIASVKMTPENGWNVVDNAYDSSLPNSVSIIMGPDSDKMKMSGCVLAAKDVNNEAAWLMSPKSVDEGASSIRIAAEGYAANITDVRGSTVGSVEWLVVSDTVTNQVLGDIADLKARMSAVESACPLPVGSVLHMTTGDDPNTLYPGTTWEKIEGKMLLSSSSGYTRGSTGGSASTTLSVDNLPSHSHSYTKVNSTKTGGTTLTAAQSGLPSHSHGMSHTHSYDKASTTTGGTAITTANLPKSFASFRVRNIQGFAGATDASGGVSLSQVNQNNATTAANGGIGANTLVTLGGSGTTHNHSITLSSTTSGASSKSSTDSAGGSSASAAHDHSISTASDNTGTAGKASPDSFTNLPPYEVVDMWKRTA